MYYSSVKYSFYLVSFVSSKWIIDSSFSSSTSFYVSESNLIESSFYSSDK